MSDTTRDTIDIDAIETAEQLDTDASIETVRDAYITEIENADLSDGTIKNYRLIIDRFCEWLNGKLKPKDITTTVLKQYLTHLTNRDLKWKTRKLYYHTVRLFIEFFDRETEAWETGPPTDHIPSQYIPSGTKSHKKLTNKNIPYVTAEQVDILCENVNGPKVRNELIIRLLFQTGLREGELSNIKLDDLDRDTHSIDIFEAKNNDYRTVYYQQTLDFLLDQWITVNRKAFLSWESPYLFNTRQSEQLRASRVNKIIKAAADNADIQEILYTDAAGKDRHAITAHALRNGHAVLSLKKGIDVRTIQHHLGHENIEQTMEYLDILDEDVRTAYQRHGPGKENDRTIENNYRDYRE